MKLLKLLYIVLIFMLFNCAPKTVPVGVEEKYEEDLSSTIPEIEPYLSPIELDMKPIDKTFVEPTMDVTVKLDSLLDSISVVNKTIPYFQYTILIHNSSSRREAEESRRNVFRILPDAKPKLQYVSPSYRVKLGKFYNKIDAYQVLVKLKPQFPNAVIVPERKYFD